MNDMKTTPKNEWYEKKLEELIGLWGYDGIHKDDAKEYLDNFLSEHRKMIVADIEKAKERAMVYMKSGKNSRDELLVIEATIGGMDAVLSLPCLKENE